MKKIFIALLALYCCAFTLQAQDRNVGIGTLTPDEHAQLELRSSEKGILIPRLTTVERDINLTAGLGAAQEGLLIYNKTTDRYNYWDGSQWIEFPSSGGSGGTGPTGPTGPATLFNTSAVNPGANCVNGGQMVSQGVDGNGNDILDAGEIDHTFFICDGIDGTGGGTGGMPGPIGPTGPTGADGMDGAAGAPGATGAQGIQGIQGPAGPTVVSADGGNSATLGTDGFIYVPTGASDHDWHEVGTSTAPDNINDNQFTFGNVGIGNSSPSVRLSVSNTGDVGSLVNFGLSSTRSGSTITSVLNSLTFNGATGTAEALQNSVGGSGDGNHRVLRNFLDNSGTGSKTLINNGIPFAAGPGLKIGISNGINSTDGQIIGINNFLGGSANSAQPVYGTYSHVFQGNGPLYGQYIWLDGNGNSTHYGNDVNLQGIGNGDQYGYRVINSNSGSGDKYGLYSSISNSLGGTHYGVYSSATKAGSFSGYFLGQVYVSYRLGIGTTTPAYDLELANDSAAKPGTSTWTVPSDSRLKKDIRNYGDGLNVIEQLNPIWYSYNGKANMPKKEFVGLLAQDLQKIAPYMVHEWEFTDSSTAKPENYLAINYGAMDFILVNSVKELADELEDVKAELKAKDEAIKVLLRRLEAVEAKLD
ncbi:MAG: tail fiber domain-containing protein [Bacteroidetes bacterium]|nr:tail fiber domain-containing protein [Bacteroidota bacterium]